MSNALTLFTRTETDEERSATSEYWSDYRTILAAGMHALVWGPPGTGKTYSALYEATDGRATYRHSCKPSDTAEDVLGRTGIKDGSTVFERGAGYFAVENGGRFIFDDVHNASEDDNALLYCLGDRKPFILADGSILTPSPRLQVILNTNEKPEDLYPLGHGIADRFPFFFIPEPSPEALETLPALFREAARRAVRSGITGFRAWQHLTEILRAHGFAPDDLLANLDADGRTENGNGFRLPEQETRERLYTRVAASVFGENGSEVLRAFRVAACRDAENVETRRDASTRVATRSRLDRWITEAYEAGRSEGLAEGLAETDHAHGAGDACSACDALYEAGEEAGREYEAEYGERLHVHDSDNDGTCEACDSVYARGNEAGYEAGYEDGAHAHAHDSDNDGTCAECDAVYEAGKREGYEDGSEAGNEEAHAEGYGEGKRDGNEEARGRLLASVEQVVSVLYGDADADAVTALLAEAEAKTDASALGVIQ